jgi:hypothetical protein
MFQHPTPYNPKKPRHLNPQKISKKNHEKYHHTRRAPKLPQTTHLRPVSAKSRKMMAQATEKHPKYTTEAS